LVFGKHRFLATDPSLRRAFVQGDNGPTLGQTGVGGDWLVARSSQLYHLDFRL